MGYKLRTKQLEQTQITMANILNTRGATNNGTNTINSPTSPPVPCLPTSVHTHNPQQGSLSNINNALPESPNIAPNRMGTHSFCGVDEKKETAAKLEESQEEMYSDPGAVRPRGQTLGSVANCDQEIEAYGAVQSGVDCVHMQHVLETPNFSEVEVNETK